MINTAKPKSWLGLVTAVLVVMAALAGGFIFQAQNAGQSNTSGESILAGYNIATEYHSEWGLNYSDHTWTLLTSVLDKNTGVVNTTVPKGISEIVLMTANTSQTAEKLADKNAFFTYTDIKIANLKGGLNDAYMYFGSYVNATGTTATADKGITDFGLNQTLYSSTVNNLGSTLELAVNNVMRSNPSSTPQYAIFLNNSGPSNTTLPITLSFTQYWQYTVEQPTYTWIALISAGLTALAFLVAYQLTPIAEGGENERVMKFQEKKEAPKAAAAVALDIVALAIIGLFGTGTPLGGWGGFVAALAMGAIFVWMFTAEPVSRTLHRTIVVFVLGNVVGFVINLLSEFSFGTIEFNFTISGNLMAQLAGWLFIGGMVVLAFVGIANTKKVHLRDRHLAKE